MSAAQDGACTRSEALSTFGTALLGAAAVAGGVPSSALAASTADVNKKLSA